MYPAIDPPRYAATPEAFSPPRRRLDLDAGRSGLLVRAREERLGLPVAAVTLGQELRRVGEVILTEGHDLKSGHDATAR